MRLSAMIATLAAALAGSTAPAAARTNWTAKVTVAADGSHVLGNPDAKVKVTEYVSYTCPHCSTFQKESEAPMRLAYVMPGKVSVNVRHYLRDPVDLTVAMLTNCGDPAGFFKRHNIFLYNQEKWFAKMGDMSEAQRKRWTTGEMATRLQAVASDFDFYSTMAGQGYTRSKVNQCLSDMGTAKRLVAQTEAAQASGIEGTPSFAIDGALLAATHNWQALDMQIKARM